MIHSAASSIEMVAFTKKGTQLLLTLSMIFAENCRAYAPEKYAEGMVMPLNGNIAAWTKERFLSGNTLIFIGAVGIAVRAIAPHVKAKDTDPALLCIDEAGRYVIPILSGHIGGANRMAQRIADQIGAVPVITTATDSRGFFSPDDWAASNNIAIMDISQIKHISAAILNGNQVGFTSQFPVASALPKELTHTENATYGIEIALNSCHPYPYTLHLVPRCLIAGIGCRKGVLAEIIERRLMDVLKQNGLPYQSILKVVSVDIKAEEPGLVALCNKWRIPFETFPPDELMSVSGVFSSSELVLSVTGADNICERAAVKAGGSLIVNKTAREGVTIALSRIDISISF